MAKTDLLSSTVAEVNKLGLDNFLRMDGLALKLIPYDSHGVLRRKLEKNLFEIYKYEHINDVHNQYIMGMIWLYSNYRVAMYVLAKSYFDSGDKVKARIVLDSMEKRMPIKLIPNYSKRLKKLINELKIQL